MQLCGRIDRIDYNPRTNAWAIFDYKTGDHFETAEKRHRKREAWLDLQLPAYLFLLRKAGVCESASLGYISLCSDPEKIGGDFVQWSEEELAQAFTLMHQVAADVFAQKFWPPKVVPSDRDDFALVYKAAKALEMEGRNE